MKRKLPILILLLCSISFSSQASHFAGATIKVQNNSNFSYDITLLLYRDCSGINAPMGVDIYFTDTSNSLNSFSATLTQSSVNPNALITCNGSLTSCNGGTNFGIEEYSYNTTVTLPAGHWVISYNSCCRNPNSTMVSPNSTSFFIYTYLNNTVANSNQIPIFNQLPNFVASSMQTGVLNYQVSDFDGDSISYKLIDALGNMNTPLAYLNGSGQTPFTSNYPVSFIGNGGALSYNVPTQMIAVVDVLVEEWRNVNGTMTLLSATLLDHEVFVMQLPNLSPTLSGLDTTLQAGYTGNDTAYSAIIIANTLFNAAIWGDDQNVSNSSTPNSGTFNVRLIDTIAGSTFIPYNSDTDSAHALFSWTPSMLDTGRIHCFQAFIADSGCPYVGTNYFNYCFLVKDSGSIVLVASANGIETNHICNHEAIELSAPDGYDSYKWSTGHTTQNILLDSNHLEIGSNTVQCLLRTGEFYYLTETEVIMDDCTGISEEASLKFKAFPNPTHSNIFITDLDPRKTYTVMLVNPQSQLIRTEQIRNSSQHILNIQELSEGIYFLYLKSGTSSGHKTFIKR